jgi:ABC-type antimicrobial peptide transport system permease subunit
MGLNFFKVAIRNIRRGRWFSVINISGLAIGMASATLILIWIQNEVSHDRFHKDQNRLYEVWGNDVFDGQLRSGTPTPEIMAPVLKGEVPEIEKVSRIDWGDDNLFAVGDKSLKPHGNLVDPDFLSIFNFPLVKGNPNSLEDPYSILITEKLGRIIFGNQDPMGKVIKVDNQENYQVTGILKDLPNNTQFNFDYLMSYVHKSMMKYIDSDWTDVSIRTFIKLKPNASLATANEKIKKVIVRHSGGRAKTTEFLYPVSKLHLYSNFENGIPSGGLIVRVRVFGAIAVLILLIACINFMNLSTARSERRAKEVGIRKVVGARKGLLVGQFLGESLLIAIISGSIALVLVEVALPAFNRLVQKQLFIDFENVYFWIAAGGFILLTGITAGSYPAFFLSAFKPVSVLKGTFKKINGLVTPRKILVIVQFSFAIAFIICTLIIEQQIRYAQQRESGYNRNNLGYVFLEGNLYGKYQLLRNELLSSGIATSVTNTGAPLTQNWSSGFSMKWDGMDPNAKILINRYAEDADLVKTAGMQLVEGRDIDANTYPSDSTACLISESAVKAMGFADPLGKIIFDDPISWHVVGVIKDFILESPYEKIKPFMVKGPKFGGGVMHIRFSGARSIGQNLALTERIFKRYNPAYPFEFHFIDEEYARKFSDEQLTATLTSLFAGLTIFISCLGLFGLVAYMAENRIKEIGVRKVLGASVTGIIALLSKEFLKLVAVAFIVAALVSWWAMTHWLQNYPYRVSISGMVFIYAGIIAFAVALLTVSYQSMRAALSNPVNSLRME